MDIKIPITTTTPGGIIETPFGNKHVDAINSDTTITLHIDDVIKAELASLLIAPSADAHLTPSLLAAHYSSAELMAALTIAFAPKQ